LLRKLIRQFFVKEFVKDFAKEVIFVRLGLMGFEEVRKGIVLCYLIAC
jgi:hypothetical protein